MRLVEFTNAEEQMALLKLIFFKTWEALDAQAKQQAQAKAAQYPKAKTSTKNKALARVGAPIVKSPLPKITPTPNKIKRAPQPPLPNNQQKILNPQTNLLPRLSSTQQKLITPVPTHPMTQNPSNDSKSAENSEKFVSTKKY